MYHKNFKAVRVQRVNADKQRWMNLFRVDYRTNNNKDGTWLFVSREEDPQLEPAVNAVIIVALVKTKDGPRLLCASEFRIPVGCREYGFHAGLIDKGEQPEEAACRELREESGLNVTKIVYTSPPIVSSAGLSDECVRLVFVEAEGIISKDKQEKNEDINSFLADKECIARLVEHREEFVGVIAAKAWPILFMFKLLGEKGLSLTEAFELMAR